MKFLLINTIEEKSVIICKMILIKRVVLYYLNVNISIIDAALKLHKRNAWIYIRFLYEILSFIIFKSLKES